MSMSLGLLIHSSNRILAGRKRGALLAASAFQFRPSRTNHHRSGVSLSLDSAHGATRRRILSSRLLSASRSSSSSSTIFTSTDNDDKKTNDTVNCQVFFETTKTFSDLGIQSEVLRKRIPFSYPTKVQAATIPSIQQGTDVTIGAETGSGKVRK